MVTIACNYDPEATILNVASCDFETCCGDPAADNYDPAISPFIVDGCVYGGDPPVVEGVGCDLPFACNFGDPTEDCEFESCAGCTEEGACNYDADATLAITCLYPMDLYDVDYVDCDGLCLNDVNENGICDAIEPVGCTDPVACNTSMTASLDDGSCEYTSCAGCTNASACNYDPTATYNDGSCDFATCVGCTNPVACNFDPSVTVEDGTCIFAQPEYDCAYGDAYLATQPCKDWEDFSENKIYPAERFFAPNLCLHHGCLAKD